MATAEALQCHAPAERAAQPMRSPSPAATDAVQHGRDESGNVEKDVRRHSCQQARRVHGGVCGPDTLLHHRCAPPSASPPR
jgi:hypothetical protein